MSAAQSVSAPTVICWLEEHEHWLVLEVEVATQ